MKAKILSSLFLISFSLLVCAQEVNPPDYKRDIGFNTTFLFQGIFQSSSTPFSFLYKRYKSENSVFRIGADISVNLTNTRIDTISDQHANERYLSASITLGKEIQKRLSNKWIWYYGFDLVPRVSLSKYENHYHNYNFPQSYRSHSSTSYSLSARPFLGIRYDISSRIYVAAEANASMTFLFAKTLEQQHNPKEVLKDFENLSMLFAMNPASGIFIFYRL